MKNKINGLTSQDISVYKIIQTSGAPITAKTISKKIDILPHAVYRSVDSLSKMNLIKIMTGKPRKYTVADAAPALQHYLLNQSEIFTNIIGETDIDSGLQIKFLQNRDDLITQATSDTQNAKKEILALVSGHEIPTELILAYKQAAARGVSIKIIFQIVNKNNRQLIKTLDNLGVEIKISKSEKMRIITFDNKITHLMSFQEESQASNLGVRLSHQSMTAMFNHILINKWKEAKPVTN